MMKKRIFSSLAGICGFAFLATPAQAASMRFEPAGAQLDADEIQDILLEPGEGIIFSNFFDNSGDVLFDFVPLATRAIDYQVTFDPLELQYVGSQLDVPGVISDRCLIGGPCGSTIEVGDGVLTISHRTALINLLFPQPEFLLDSIAFVGVGVNDSPGDGLSDYFISGSNRAPLGIQISSFSTSTVEVQRVPGPLPLLGLGAAFGASRRLRRRLSSSRLAAL
jgi:hypothetical protein